MTMQDRLAAFSDLRETIAEYLAIGKCSHTTLLNEAIEEAHRGNAWFTQHSIRQSLKGICTLLEDKSLAQWVSRYSFDAYPKKVACILAGNIPMVGFHDMLCVLISGNHFIGKLSSKDSKLLPALAKILGDLHRDFKTRFTFVENLQGVAYDAVIATGSNNSARYFEHYFGKKPHIIRKGRSSIAILSGEETNAQFEGLADDIFMFFGLGCRNVSKLYIPKGFDIREIFPHFEKYHTHTDHHKWMHNYDYNRAINLVNQQDFYETGFALFQENVRLVSPIAMVYYETYNSLAELKTFLQHHAEQLQCIVSAENEEDFVPLGKAQFPKVDDYADGIDTLAFLQKIKTKKDEISS